MKNLEISRISGQDQRIAQLLASGIESLIVLLGMPSFFQNICASFGIKRYITMADLSHLYFTIPEQNRSELRPLLDQIATDFSGWLNSFKKNRFDKTVRPMIVSELILSAATTAERQILSKSDLEKDEKKQLLKTMKQKAEEWAELMDILSQEFDIISYKKALRLAKGDKDKLLSMTRLRISNQRRAYIYRKLIEIKDQLTNEELLSIYEHLKTKSMMRPRIFEILSQRQGTFCFWFRIYRDEHSHSQLKQLSWNNLASATAAPEILVNTCNDCSDERFINMAAEKLRAINLNNQRWKKLYEQAKPTKIRETILDKLRLAITLDSSYRNSLKFIFLRSLYAESINYPEITENTLIDMINLLPGRQDPTGSYASAQEFSSHFILIKNLIIERENSDTHSLRRLAKAIAPKIRNHEEWIDFSIQCKPYKQLRELIIEEYKEFFIKEFCRTCPYIKTTTTDFRNRRVYEAWKPQLYKIAA